MPLNLPDGAWVTMITPFLSSGQKQIDWFSVDNLVEWFIQSGIVGLFAVCQSSEMYFLSDDERVDLAKRVVQTAKGRVPVVACGTFSEDIEDQAKFVQRMYKETGVEAVVVIASMMCKETESEEVWKKNVQRLLDLTENVPLGIYECPKPYHRLLSPETLAWAASTGRFYFHKDTCCSILGIENKLKALQSTKTNFKFYNANMATLLNSITMGASGFCGIAANCYPHLIAWLCQHAKGELFENCQVLQYFLSVAELTVANKYPQSAKLYLRKCEPHFKDFGTSSRISDLKFNEEEELRIVHLNNLVKHLANQIHTKSMNLIG